MSITVLQELPLWCGCIASVRRHPPTGNTLSRTVASRGRACPNPEHRPGASVWLTDLLPDHGWASVEPLPALCSTVVDSVTESILAREKKTGK